MKKHKVNRTFKQWMGDISTFGTEGLNLSISYMPPWDMFIEFFFLQTVWLMCDWLDLLSTLDTISGFEGISAPVSSCLRNW